MNVARGSFYAKQSVPLPPCPPPPPPPPPLPSEINATVPGDIISDLQRAGVVNDPYYNTNWSLPTFVAAWNSGVWVYSKRFATPPAGGAGGRVLLVLEGIRNGATILLNGVVLGNATNAYRRYVYDLDATALRQQHDAEQPNELQIRFGSSLQINCDGRYTHSQQIDWAPAMPTSDPLSPQRPPWGPRSTFGFAIWKSVYLVPMFTAVPAITDLVVHTFYAGGHPTSFLTDQGHSGFEVQARVELYCPANGETEHGSVLIAGQPCAGAVTFRGSWPKSRAVISDHVTIPSGEYVMVNLTVPHTETVGAALWQPRGNGAPHRYNATATFASTSAGASVSASRQIGFRHVALVTVNDTDPSVRQMVNTKNITHTSGFTMMFRVNGAPIYARGGAKVPMDLMEGRFTAAGHRRLVQSAVNFPLSLPGSLCIIRLMQPNGGNFLHIFSSLSSLPVCVSTGRGKFQPH